VSNRLDVWNLLVARQGEWVTRAQVEQVGGLESMRRLREVRGMALGQGYSFDQRKTDGLLEYRLDALTEQVRSPWSCVKCEGQPAGHLQPTTDTADRWRTGWCVLCGNKKAIFKRDHSA
jgi:hypothetical protein